MHERGEERKGEIVEVRCTYDSATRSGGAAAETRKVKGTIHWLAAAHALPAEVRLYDHLFTKPNPEEVPAGQDFTANFNPNSLETLSSAFVEPGLKNAAPGSLYQFERNGYFCVEAKEASAKRLVFNRAVTLRDTWAKIEKKAE